MQDNYLCISIPVELQQYQKSNRIADIANGETVEHQDFGVKVIKNSHGEIECTAYYSDSGELLKKIFYKGSAVSCIKHYRNGKVSAKETFDEGRLKRKIKYNKSEKPTSTFNYEYNAKNQVTAIRKVTGSNKYEVEYGYDELSRVDSRIIKLNSKIHLQQKYKYDILDRVVEYYDRNQHIKVHKLSQNNELLSYTITDIAGNDIIVVNKYMCSEYIGTEIDLNGHKATVKDKCYVDNVILKKPFTSEDDLDLVLSNIFTAPAELSQTKRKCDTDISTCIISNGINSSLNAVVPQNKVKPLILDIE